MSRYLRHLQLNVDFSRSYKFVIFTSAYFSFYIFFHKVPTYLFWIFFVLATYIQLFSKETLQKWHYIIFSIVHYFFKICSIVRLRGIYFCMVARRSTQKSDALWRREFQKNYSNYFFLIPTSHTSNILICWEHICVY